MPGAYSIKLYGSVNDESAKTGQNFCHKFLHNFFVKNSVIYGEMDADYGEKVVRNRPQGHKILFTVARRKL